MELDKIFGFLVPKDHKFFPLFTEATANMVLASGFLVKLVSETEADKRNEYIASIKNAEQKSDELMRRMSRELNSTFITPFDREDVHELIVSLDNVVNHINSASKKINYYRQQNLPSEFVIISELIHQAVKEIDMVISNVHTVHDFKKYIDSAKKISEMESKVDDMYQAFLSNLFEKEINAIEVIRQRDILTSLEKAIDKCEDVANVFSTLTVKMG